MSASNVVCFETFRQERDSRRSQGREGENVATESAPFQARLAGVLLSARQIEHRRRMLEFGRQLGTTTVAPISRRASRSLSLTSASWRRSIGSINGSWLSRND